MGDSSKYFWVVGYKEDSSADPVASKNTSSHSINTGLACLFFLLSQENCLYRIVSLAWVCGLVCWLFGLVFLPLASRVCVTFYSTGRGKSERVLLQMTFLILLGAHSLGL